MKVDWKVASLCVRQISQEEEQQQQQRYCAVTVVIGTTSLSLFLFSPPLSSFFWPFLYNRETSEFFQLTVFRGGVARTRFAARARLMSLSGVINIHDIKLYSHTESNMETNY